MELKTHVFATGSSEFLWATAFTGARMPDMDVLTAYGFLSVSLMLVFYTLEDRSPWFVLAFSGSCLMSSVYGFIQGAWPFGAVEGVWTFVALRRWWLVYRNSPLAISAESVFEVT